MATFEKTEVLTEIFMNKYSDRAHAYAALSGALLGTLTEEQVEMLLEMYS